MIRQLTLENAAATEAGQKRFLTAGQALTIGRTESADWAFPYDREMSGRHFTVACDAESCRLRDLDSLNGSWVNGQRVEATVLQDGDGIRAGGTSFVVNIVEDAPTMTRPAPRAEPEAPRTEPAPDGATPVVPEPVPDRAGAEPRVLPVQPQSLAVVGIVTLRITAGPHAGQRIWLRAGQSVTVGMAESADFALPQDGYLSRVHFELQHAGQRCLLRDCQSTNGVLVNGARVGETGLNPGDQIQAGQSTFVAEFETIPVDSGSRAVESPAQFQRDTDTPAPLMQAVSAPAATTSPTDVAVGPEATGIPVAEPTTLLQIVNETPLAVRLFPRENLKGEPRLTVIVKATLRIDRDGSVRLAEPQLPVFTADQHYGDNPLASVRFESDVVPHKPRADIVLVGRAHAPHGQPVPRLDVGLRVGSLRRTLRVFGQRHWRFRSRLVLVPTMSAPEPFTTMDLVYERAFGGIDSAAACYCERNLAGVGFVGALTPASIDHKPLPNVEDPRDLIQAWDSRPRPVGFGFYGRGWQPRLHFAGTYDEQYRQERAPLWPQDFSYEFFNGAHPDLQVEGYLRGDEEVELEHLSPEGLLRFQLPGLQPRVTIVRCGAPGEHSFTQAGGRGWSRPEERLPLVLDTLVLVPDQRLCYVVFRGTCALRSLEAVDVASIRVTN